MKKHQFIFRICGEDKKALKAFREKLAKGVPAHVKLSAIGQCPEMSSFTHEFFATWNMEPPTPAWFHATTESLKPATSHFIFHERIE